MINYLKITTKTHHNISLNEDYFVRFANVNEDYHIMSKTTMGTKLPRKLEEKMKVVGGRNKARKTKGLAYQPLPI